MTFRDLIRLPFVQAPMAAGVTTPELVAEVCRAGGLGFLAAGYVTPDHLRGQIAKVRAQTSDPFGVNVFVPGDGPQDQRAIAGYRAELEAEAERYATSVGPVPDQDDDHWNAKLDLLTSEPVPIVSFTFGCPPAEVVLRLQDARTQVVVTVTSAAEAVQAAGAGADALCVQGIEAGGHRGSFLPDSGDLALLPLLAQVRQVTGLPLLAAGGLMTGSCAAAVIAAGAYAAQLGTAFIATPESGAAPVYKAALTEIATTSLTRAFSGKPARGLTNRFIVEHADAPIGYPAIHHMTRPIRQAAAAAGDRDGMSLWAGQGHRLARALPVGDLIRQLAAELGSA